MSQALTSLTNSAPKETEAASERLVHEQWTEPGQNWGISKSGLQFPKAISEEKQQ